VVASPELTYGVLAMQGAFREHIVLLQSLGQRAVAVRTPGELAAIDALIIPGGESTTIRKQLVSAGLYDPLRARIADDMPTFGTCAGLIVLARAHEDGAPPTYGAFDLDVERNGFGRQRYSFEATVRLSDGSAMHAVFIRAPRIATLGNRVEVMATLDGGTYSGEPVAVRQGSLLGCTFHPELADEPALHRIFVAIAEEQRGRAQQMGQHQAPQGAAG
jgi:5'-phosphate synthase pdxT subunit